MDLRRTPHPAIVTTKDVKGCNYERTPTIPLSQGGVEKRHAVRAPNIPIRTCEGRYRMDNPFLQPLTQSVNSSLKHISKGISVYGRYSPSSQYAQKHTKP